MASGNVVIRFVTGYVGKGIDLLKSAMSSTGRLVARSIGAMATAFGELASFGGKQIGGFISELGSFGKMVAQGGVWGAATFAVTKSIELIIARMNAAKEAAKESAKAVAGHFQDAADAISRRFKAITDTISNAASRARELLGFRNAGHEASVAEAVAEVNAKERESLAKAKDNGEEGVIRANANLERAKIQAAERTRQSTAKLAEAEADVGRARERVDAANAERDALYEELVKVRSAAADLRFRKMRREDVDEALKTAEDAEKKAEKAFSDATERLAAARRGVASAEIARDTAAQKNRQVESEAAEQVAAAEFAMAETLHKQEEAADKEAAKRAEEATKRAEEAARIEAEIEAEEAETEAREALAETYQNLAEQAKEKGREQVRQMQRLNASIFRVQRRYDDALRGIDRTRRGQAADAAHTNGLFGPYQYGGRSNGGENFIDWDRANRFAGWGDRDARKAARRDAAAQKRYDRIRDALENGETVSKADEAFFGKFKAYQDQKGGAEKLKNELEAAQKKRDHLQEEMKKTLESIDKNIKDALAVG